MELWERDAMEWGYIQLDFGDGFFHNWGSVPRL